MAKEYKELFWTDEMTTRFWDWQSQYPDVYFTNLFGKEIAEKLYSYISSKDSVLDFGCGVGFLMSHLVNHFNEVFGTDISDHSVQVSNERNADFQNYRGSCIVSDLLSENRKFEAITCVEVLEHLYDNQLDSVLDCIHNLLDESGVVIFTTPNNEDLEKNMILCPTSGELFHRWQHVRSWNKDTLGSYLEKSRFKIIDIFETDLTRKKLTSLSSILKLIMHGYSSQNPHLICIAQKG